MEGEWLVRRVCERTGAHAREARRAIGAAVEVLAGCLDASARHALSRALPPEHARRVDRAGEPRPIDLDTLYAEVRRRSRLPAAKSVEASQAVLEALAEALDVETLALVRHDLDERVAAQLVPRDAESAQPAHVRVHPPSSRPRPPTLSTGRPGPAAPLYAARPEPAQRHSPAGSADPHRDTKLSSARGTTQEQDDRTLSGSARGR